MKAVKEREVIRGVLSLLPRPVSAEILRRAELRVGGLGAVREIRLRREGVSSLLLSRERVRLSSRVSGEELCECLGRLCDGAVYSRRDELMEGFVTLPGGVRVGIGGRAGYDGERLVGVSDIRSLVFRIPTGECEFIDGLFEIYSGGIGRGMLIYSPPGVGKTTALRALARRVSSGKFSTRVALIDERGELGAEDFSNSEAEVLTGYKKSVGMEIATRTLSPELIFVDELSSADAEAVRCVMRSGVPIVATAHASSLSDLERRTGLRELIADGAFSLFVGISYTGGGYFLEAVRK